MNLKTINRLKNDIWLLHEQQMPAFKAIVIKSLKIFILSVQGFYSDHCPLRASALTLYSILSIVPVFAMLFGIAKGFGFEKILEQQLLEKVPSQDTMLHQLIGFAQNMLNSTKGEIVAGFGLVVLFWTVINVISNIEESFNYIWKVNKGRSLSRKLSDYLSLMLLAPVLLIGSSSITVLLNIKVTWLITVIELPKFGTSLVLGALSLSPLALMVGLFTFTLIFMPNHKIDYRTGIIAGFVTGILYYLLQWVYLSLQFGVSSYNAIYGSFAALPLFVIWLQLVWMILLFGCEVAFFLQNYESCRNNNRIADLSLSLKKIIALQITHLVVKNFSQLANPLTADEIASRLVIPLSIVRPLLSTLTASHILVEYKLPNIDDEVYQPAVDINILTVAFVINALEHQGRDHLPDIGQEQLFINAINSFRQLMESSEQNILLKNM